MKLNTGDDSHNVYILYSDLLFNLLILFLILVLALVLRMHGTIEAVQHSRPSSDAQEKQIQSLTEQRDSIAQQLASLQRVHDTDTSTITSMTDQVTAAYQKMAASDDKLRAAVARADAAEQQSQSQQKAVSEQLQQQLAIAAGANRFTGRSGETEMCVAIDLSKDEPQYALLSATASDSASSTLDGESDDDHKVRATKVLKKALDNAPRFSLDRLSDIFRALSVRVGPDHPNEGSLLFSTLGRATFVASGWEDDTGDMIDGAMPQRYQEMISDRTYSDFHAGLIDRLIKLRDTLHPATAPETVPVLHFSLSTDRDHLHVGNSDYTLDEFRHIVASFGGGGIILQYDPSQGELCPDWIISDVLTPTGYVNSVPDVQQLVKLRSQLQGGNLR